MEHVNHIDDDLDQRATSQSKKSKKHADQTSATPEKKVNGGCPCSFQSPEHTLLIRCDPWSWIRS